ncbi:MAG: excisionase family DNA-binding protein [Actinomycetes bacterium]|jgi:excisionase family DNA binding protein
MIVEAIGSSENEKLTLLVDGEELKLSAQVTKELIRFISEVAKGNPVSVGSIETLLTTQEAADYLGYSRPTLIKLLDEYKVPFSQVGKHRRVAFYEVQKLQNQIQTRQQKAIRDLQKLEVELGLLDFEE